MSAMLITSDRRTRKDRRGPIRVEDRIERKAGPPRRREDRRDSPRVPRIIHVRELGEDGEFEKAPGDVAVGGVRWRSDHYPSSRQVELTLRIPGYARPVTATARIVRVELLDDELQLHATFEEIDVKDELAIARFIHGRAALASVIEP